MYLCKVVESGPLKSGYLEKTDIFATQYFNSLGYLMALLEVSREHNNNYFHTNYSFQRNKLILEMFR